MSHFYGTGYEVWAGFKLVGNIDFSQWQAIAKKMRVLGMIVAVLLYCLFKQSQYSLVMRETRKHNTKRIDNQLKLVPIWTAVSGNWEVPCYPPLGILSPRWGLPSTGLVLRCSQTCLTLGVTWRMLLTRVFGKDPLDTTSTPPIYRYLVSRNKKNVLLNNFLARKNAEIL